MIRTLAPAVLLCLALTACHSISDRRQTGIEAGKSGEVTGDTRAHFENAIARRILSDILEELPALTPGQRTQFLLSKKQLFEASVNPALTGNRIRFEKQLLDHLYRQSDLARHGAGYLPTLQAKTSLDWSLSDYERLVRQELNRIDQRIAELSQDSHDNFDLARHMEQQRNQARYFPDSVEGRQQYLDSLADAMLTAQLDWHDTFEQYKESELAIYGEEDMDQMFRYSSDGLTINLGEIRSLPEFELKPLAAFYGFPGMGSFTPPDPDSLLQFVRLPAYTLGWGAYIVDAIGTRDTDRNIEYLYFSRMLAALALADLRLNTGNWTRALALEALYQTLPYSKERLTMMLNEVQADPGQHAAALAGKVMFVRFHERCLAEGRGDACQAVYNQRIVDWGPLPFDMLRQRLYD